MIRTSQIKTAFLLAAGLLLSGCSASIDVQTTFPEPLVDALPLTAGVYYTSELTDYTYNEELPMDNIDWTFSIGAANQLLFDSIFRETFSTLIAVDGPTANGVDVILEPAIQALEFSLPRQSRNNQYAVWIRYSINVYSPDGKLRSTVPVPGYGEVDSRRLKGKESMRKATVGAMRDAASIIIESLTKDTALRRAVMGHNSPVEDTQAADMTEAEAIEIEALESSPEQLPENPAIAGEEFISET
ncbi:MAG: hypothetical protein ACR2QB_01540 [Gammaproteobacteria bacterium]